MKLRNKKMVGLCEQNNRQNNSDFQINNDTTPIKVQIMDIQKVNNFNSMSQINTLQSKFWKIHKIPKDGSCFFHSLSIELNKSMENIKEEIIQWNIYHWNDFVQEQSFEGITVGQLIKMTHFDDEILHMTDDYIKNLYYKLFLSNDDMVLSDDDDDDDDDDDEMILTNQIPWAGCSEQYAASQLYNRTIRIFEGICLHSSSRIRCSRLISKAGEIYMRLERNAILKEIQTFGKNSSFPDICMLFHRPSLHYMLLHPI
jgi:hypothetical protein